MRALARSRPSPPRRRPRRAGPEPVIRAGVTVAGLDVGGLTLVAGGRHDRPRVPPQLVTRNVVRRGSAARATACTTKKIGFVFDPAKSARARVHRRQRHRRRPTAGRRAAVDATYDKQKLRRASSRAWTAPPASRRATRTVRITLRHMRQARAPRAAARWTSSALAEALDARADRPARRRARCARRARSSRRRCARRTSRSRYRTVVTISKSALPAAAVQAAEVRQVLRRRRRPARLPDADRPVQRSPTRPSTRPGPRPNSPWAGALPQRDGRGRLGREPAQGALDGHRQRRRHPRHGRAVARSARRASHGCIRMTRART